MCCAAGRTELRAASRETSDLNGVPVGRDAPRRQPVRVRLRRWSWLVAVAVFLASVCRADGLRPSAKPTGRDAPSYCSGFDVRFQLPADTESEVVLYRRGPVLLSGLAQHGSVPRLCHVDGVVDVIATAPSERVTDVWSSVVRAYQDNPPREGAEPRRTSGPLTMRPTILDGQHGVELHQSLPVEWVPSPDARYLRSVEHTHSELWAFSYTTARELMMVVVIGSNVTDIYGPDVARVEAEELAKERVDAVRSSLTIRR